MPPSRPAARSVGCDLPGHRQWLRQRGRRNGLLLSIVFATLWRILRRKCALQSLQPIEEGEIVARTAHIQLRCITGREAATRRGFQPAMRCAVSGLANAAATAPSGTPLRIICSICASFCSFQRSNACYSKVRWVAKITSLPDLGRSPKMPARNSTAV